MVIRKGKLRHEFLLVRSIVKKRIGDPMVGHALVFEPRGLSKGRGGWEVFQGVIDVAPLLRTEGAKGIAIQSFCFDGALFSCLRRRLLGRAEVYYSQVADLGERSEEFWAIDWTLVLRCASHAGSLAVQWGLKVKPISIDQTADDIHIGMSSLIYGRSAIHDKIEAFVAQRLQFCDGRTGSGDEIRAWWTHVGASTDMNLFVSTDLRWDGEVSEAEKQVLGIACVSAYVGEQFVLDLFSDDRLLKVAREYWDNLMDEVYYVVKVLPAYCFVRLLQVFGLDLDFGIFRDRVIRSVHASLAYLHMSVFDQLDRYPLVMCKGDMEQHIGRLREMDYDDVCKLDVLTRKLWWLAQNGFNIRRFKEGLGMMSEAAFTTNSVEQNHRHGAMLTKLHALYEEDILRNHCLVMQAKHLVGLSAQERAKARLQAKLEKLLSRKPSMAHGFLAFKTSAEGEHMIGDDAGADNDERCPLARTRARTKQFASAWRALPPERRAAHEAFARARAASMQHRIEEEAADIREALSWSDRREAKSLTRSGCLPSAQLHTRVAPNKK